MALRTLAGLFAALILACSTTAAPAQSTLRVVPLNELKILDPIWTTAYATRDHGFMVYDTLMGLDENFRPQPQMADSWTVSADQLVWTFTLRDGLKWHDGTPVTAEDCVASLRRWAARDTLGQILAGLWTRLDARDDRTIVIELKAPFGLMLDVLAKQSSNPAFMMPKRVAATDPFKAIDDPIGSGPFIFKTDEWMIGSKAVYVRNPNYVPRKEPASGTAGGKVVKVDRAELVSLPDATTVFNALQRGEVDYWLQPPVDLLKKLEEMPRIKVTVNDSLGNLSILRLNHLAAPLSNKKVRQAILTAIDQSRVMLGAVGDPKYFRTCYAMFPCGSPWQSPKARDFKEGDVQKAKAMLQEAGYKNEKIVLLQATDMATTNALALMVADTLKQIGMNVELQAMDYQTIVARRTKKTQIADGGWSGFTTQGIAVDFLDPFSILFSANGDKGWVGWVDEPRIEQLKRAFVAEPDVDKRKTIAANIEDLAYDTVAYVPLGMSTAPIAYRDRVKGILRSPLFLYWNISVQ